MVDVHAAVGTVKCERESVVAGFNGERSFPLSALRCFEAFAALSPQAVACSHEGSALFNAVFIAFKGFGGGFCSEVTVKFLCNGV